MKKKVLIVSPCIYVIVDKNETTKLILFEKRCKVVRNKQTKKQTKFDKVVKRYLKKKNPFCLPFIFCLDFSEYIMAFLSFVCRKLSGQPRLDQKLCAKL